MQTQPATLRCGMEELVSAPSWLAPSGPDLQHSGRAAVAHDCYKGYFSHQSMPHHPRRRSAHGAPQGGKPDGRSYNPPVIASHARPKQDGKLHLELRRNPGKENAHRPFGGYANCLHNQHSGCAGPARQGPPLHRLGAVPIAMPKTHLSVHFSFKFIKLHQQRIIRTRPPPIAGLPRPDITQNFLCGAHHPVTAMLAATA
ncbi:MAG: hypothetical protein JWN85_4957 [Gammaproteobacteria bacterium]|nr:hypothetical protein [Gammaproteobacteria bacterium]